MSQQITEAFYKTYESIVEHLLQEQEKLTPTVMVKNGVRGTRFRALNQIGARNATRINSRHQRTIHTDTPHAARWIDPKHYADADLFDEEDDLESLIDPTNEYAQAQAMAIGRAKDAEIILALGRDVVTGADDEGTAIAFDTTNQQVASGSVGLNTDKIEQAMMKLLQANVDPTRERLTLVCAPFQHNEMMSETKAISKDYMEKPVVTDGFISRYGGFDFVISNQLPKVGNDRYIYCYAKSAVRFANWGSGIKARMDVMPDFNYSTQVHTKASFGAVRAEEGKVVRILCDET